jgi:hypothetical protein
MRSIHIAEWILGLVTSAERASPTVGDLAEQASSRGAVWLWSAVMRTAFALMWRQVREDPLRVTGAALLGVAVDVGASYIFICFIALLYYVVAAYQNLHVPHLLNAAAATWNLAGPLVASLAVGRVLARLATGREIAVCFVYVVLLCVCGLILLFFVPTMPSPAWALGILEDLAQQAPVFAGAVWGRRLACRSGKLQH